jgi:transcription factor WhiB
LWTRFGGRALIRAGGDGLELDGDAARGVGWRARARCRSMPTAIFYATGGAATFETRVALRVCARCEVRPQCLDAALDADELGVWGGVSEERRRRLRAARRSPRG